MPSIITPGALSARGFGFAKAAAGLAVGSVFATTLYTGNGGAQTITNGLDLAGSGGLVWEKERTVAANHYLMDTVRGDNAMHSNTSAANDGTAPGITYNSTGYSWATSWPAADTIASWCFRRAAKFFDVVSWTGDGTATRMISHSLGVQPAFIVVKATNAVGNWWCCVNAGSNFWWRGVQLNSNTGGDNNGGGGFTLDSYNTSTQFMPQGCTDGNVATSNASGTTYVAYLFAQDPTGIVQLGTFTTDGAASGSFNTGWANGAQFVMVKPLSSTGDWIIFDTARTPSFSGSDAMLWPDLTTAEATGNDISMSGSSLSFLLSSGITYMCLVVRAP